MRTINTFIILSLILSLLVSCSGVDHISQEVQSGKTKIAVVASLTRNTLQVFDHKTKDIDLSGELLVGLMLSQIVDKHELKSALGGDYKELRDSLKHFPILNLFNEKLEEGFDVGLETFFLSDISERGIKIENYTKMPNGSIRRDRKDYRVLKKELDVDLVLDVRLTFGLARHKMGLKPTVAMAANVSYIDTKYNQIRIRKVVHSDEYYRNQYTVDEYLENNPELFEKEILKSINIIVGRLSAEFKEEFKNKN